ncbi:MAG TPA: hypothetical protein VHZ31_01270 [Solirubrobacteraceae bacterium]|jgi:hypothetical protein|nr:hypothetical protein [Solirubrobacteraceae bacterium]
MFPAALAAILGIDLIVDCATAMGTTAGGTTTNHVYQPGVDAIVMGEKIHLGATFNQGLPVILLGRCDFFALYRVSFDERRQQFGLDRYDAAP